jgi:hypothetical protein
VRRALVTGLVALLTALAPSTTASGSAPTHGDRLDAAPIPTRVAAKREHDPENEPSYPPATGPRRVAVLLASGASEVANRFAAEHIEERMFGPGLSVAEHVAGQSRGRATVEGDVLGWYTVDEPEGCNYYETTADAMAEAKAAGVRFADYHYVMTVFPRRSCGWNGMAEIGGEFSYINGLPPDFRLLAHEFGHNLGFYHAWAHHCSDGGRATATTGTCTREEYGDPFDVMGRAGRSFFHGFHRARLGWIPPEDVRIVEDEAVYTLRSVNDAGAGTKILQVERPVDDDGYGTMLGPRYFAVELRSPMPAFDDFAPGEPIVSGVTIRLTLAVNWMWPTKLLDVTPGSPGGHGDAVLGVGQSFTDPPSGARFTLESLAGGTGRVRLSYPPTAPQDVRAEPAGEDGVALSWSPSTDAKGVAAYEVERDGAVVSRTAGTTAADGSLERGRTFTYRVIAIDTDGNRTASEPVTASTPPLPVAPTEDSTAPPPPPPPPAAAPDTTKPRLRVTRPRLGRRVPRTRRLALLASDDRAGVRIRATLDGRLLRTARATRVSLLLPRRALRRRHRLTLTAIDAAGNRTVVRLRIVRGRLLRA